MKFKIPSQFDLAGMTFTVVSDPAVKKLAGCCGQTHFDEALIIIDPHQKPDTLGITYYHELVHAILMTMGQNDLNKDESFVDNFASLLWQAQKTATY